MEKYLFENVGANCFPKTMPRPITFEEKLRRAHALDEQIRFGTAGRHADIESELASALERGLLLDEDEAVHRYGIEQGPLYALMQHIATEYRP